MSASAEVVHATYISTPSAQAIPAYAYTLSGVGVVPLHAQGCYVNDISSSETVYPMASTVQAAVVASSIPDHAVIIAVNGERTNP
jgi:hypothetical protein